MPQSRGLIRVSQVPHCVGFHDVRAQFIVAFSSSVRIHSWLVMPEGSKAQEDFLNGRIFMSFVWVTTYRRQTRSLMLVFMYAKRNSFMAGSDSCGGDVQLLNTADT